MKEITLLGVRPHRPELPRGAPTEIRLNILLAYLKGMPVVHVVLDRRQLITLIKECVTALEVIERENP